MPGKQILKLSNGQIAHFIHQNKQNPINRQQFSSRKIRANSYLPKIVWQVNAQLKSAW